MERTPTQEVAPRTPVLVNESAGMRAGGIATRLREALERKGLEVDVRAVEPRDLEDQIRAEADGGARVVAIAGGDGSLLAAARILAGRDITLAPIPTGTLNHFSRRLGIEGIDAAADALESGETAEVPVGVVDDHVFLNTATFGLYAEVVTRRERLRPWLTKWPAALAGFGELFVRMRHLDVVLEVDGERLERRTPLLWVGMGWGSFPRVHEARERRSQPDLEIVVVRPASRLGMLAFLPRLLLHILRANRPVEDPALEVLHARNVLVEAERRVGVTLDGEVLRLTAPIYIGVVDHALRVRRAREEEPVDEV